MVWALETKKEKISLAKVTYEYIIQVICYCISKFSPIRYVNYARIEFTKLFKTFDW